MVAISDQAMKALVEYDWPGNVRELENAIERAVVLAENDVIGPSDLLYYGRMTARPFGPSTYEVQRLEEVERDHIEKAFATCVGAKHCLAVTNCTSALIDALIAVGVGPGDEVIVTVTRSSPPARPS